MTGLPSDIIAAVQECGTPGNTLPNTMDRIQFALVREAMNDANGRNCVAARRLGLTREGLYKIRKRLGMHIAVPTYDMYPEED